LLEHEAKRDDDDDDEDIDDSFFENDANAANKSISSRSRRDFMIIQPVVVNSDNNDTTCGFSTSNSQGAEILGHISSVTLLTWIPNTIKSGSDDFLLCSFSSGKVICESL
jgi:hypothetical protein